MTSIYDRERRAIQNWHQFGIHVHLLRSVGLNLNEAKYRQQRFQGRDEIKKAWFEGQYVILPNTTWYRLWDILKSVGYMISLYTLAYDAAFQFESGTKTESFEQLIDVI